MAKQKKTGATAERYIEATMDLIAERGGSTQVNLREISRRIGCAHTNAYNYFASREDLLWAAFRRTLEQYGAAMTAGLDDTLSGHAYFQRMIRNMIEWSFANPGLHRFISSDPLNPEHIPQDIFVKVSAMKRWFFRVLLLLSREHLDAEHVASLVDILLGYLDGEVFNLINGRVLPGEDVAGRVLENLERLFTLLTAKSHDGISLAEQASTGGALRFPKLQLRDGAPW